MDQGATDCFLCGTEIASQEPDIVPELEETVVEESDIEEQELEETTIEDEPEFEQIMAEETSIEEPELEEFVCPMCGTGVGADASECPGCGESFSLMDNGQSEGEYYDEETSVEGTEMPLSTPDDELTIPEEVNFCPDCESQLTEDGSCPNCAPPETTGEASDGCPICGGKGYTVESGDLVSCGDCGNVYIRKEYAGSEQNWKWKFWVGLVFIIVGDIGVALGSYVHNVFEWSPLGTMYLGYGWMDQLVGLVGIVLFIVGLVLFAWSFKREREVQCPSCKVIVLEDQLTEVDDDEEELVPEEIAVESVLEEIGEAVECPGCGSGVSMFDTSCDNCGALFEMEDDFEEELIEDLVEEPEEPEGPVEVKHGSELDVDDMIMESLELEDSDESVEIEGLEESVELNGDSLEALNELESAIDSSLDDEVEINTCPSCGAIVGKGLDTCPGCGEAINSEGGE